MNEAIRRTALIGVSLGLCALVMALGVGALVGRDGMAAPGVLASGQPVVAFLTALVVGAIALAISMGVGRLTNAVVGLFVFGGALSVLSMRSGSLVDAVVNDITPLRLGIETLLWSAALLLAAMGMFRVAGPLKDIEFDPDDPYRGSPFSPMGLLAAAAGLVTLLPVWLIARSELKGQALAAATIGALAAAILGRLLAKKTQPVLLFVIPCVAGGIGHVLIHFMYGTVELSDVPAGLTPLATVMPIDYAAGTLIGAAIGIGWTKSSPEKRP